LAARFKLLGGNCTIIGIIGFEILGDDLDIGLTDRRAESVDHLGDLRVPNGAGHEWRVHLDVIKTVAGTTMGLHLVKPGRLLELNGFLLGESRRRNEGTGKDHRNRAHERLFRSQPI